MSDSRTGVLVVDDSAVVRGLMARAVENEPTLQLLGTAMHGEAALRQLERTPADVVVLDVEMPVMDGLETLQQIQVRFPRTHVIMASALTQDGAETTCRALSLGAAGCIAKPSTSSISDSIRQVTGELVPLIHALARKRTGSPGPRTEGPLRLAPHVGPKVPPSVLAIGSSTGGPQALRVFLTSLPRDFPLPIFIVQHMPPLFTPMLARHLEKDTGRPCQEAVDQQVVEPGHTYVAPGDFHVEVVRQDGSVRTRLTQAPAEHFCRPSVNPLFRSVAQVYAGAALAVMLTGMGEDGLDGSRELVTRGGRLLAQDEATSVVWGMPGAVVRAGLVSEVLPLDRMGPRVLQLCLAEVRR